MNTSVKNIAMLDAGDIDAIPTRETVAKTVDLLTPFTQGALETLYGHDAECQRLEAELYARRMAVAGVTAKSIYAKSIDVAKRVLNSDGSISTKWETLTVKEAAQYATELISLRAEVAKQVEPRNNALFDEGTKYEFYRTQLESIKVFLKNLGFNTQYGAEGIYAVARADV